MDFLKNKVVVVTGGSSGIGRAVALRLANDGAICCIIGRNREKLEEVEVVAREKSLTVHVYAYDLQKTESIRAIEAEISKTFGRVDVLVNSSGVYYSDTFQNASVYDLDELYNSNIRGQFLMIQSMLPMICLNKGQIVFINSSQAINASGGLGQYAASQHALKAFADSLREEVNPKGVRVLSLFLGRTATPRMEAIYEKAGKPYNPELLLQPEDVASVVANTLALPATAEITNISMRPAIKSY